MTKRNQSSDQDVADSIAMEEKPLAPLQGGQPVDAKTIPDAPARPPGEDAGPFYPTYPDDPKRDEAIGFKGRPPSEGAATFDPTIAPHDTTVAAEEARLAAGTSSASPAAWPGQPPFPPSQDAGGWNVAINRDNQWRPTIGGCVLYMLSQGDADEINRGHVTGNLARVGQVLPATVVVVWGDNEAGAVNLQVMLDGPGTFWAASRHQVGPDASDGDKAGHWFVQPAA